MAILMPIFYVVHKQNIFSLILHSLFKNTKTDGVKFIGNERRRMVSIFLQTIFLRKYEDTSPNYLHRRELVMFGLIFFWCLFNWEVVILGRAAHQLTNTNDVPFVKMTAINHLNYCKVNLQGRVHGKVRKWF